MSDTPNLPGIHFAFDVGHSSIGWAVLQAEPPTLLGCGAVVFPADDCLASQRRQFRRQRRHIRATRLRVARLKRLLLHLGVLDAAQLDEVSSSSPWLLAARVLRGGAVLTWPELWDVLRWYAHNRGYDGNRGWSRQDIDEEDQEDTDKEKRAGELLDDFQKRFGRSGTMAEVFCDVLGLDPLGAMSSSTKRVRDLGAAFPRKGVEAEVERVLRAHVGVLPRIDETFIVALLRDHTQIPGANLRLPARYGQRLANGTRTPGGVLFGQLVPRFDNRIIATCPITYQRVRERVFAETGDQDCAHREAQKLAKVPGAGCPEYHRYRWAMQLANVQIATNDERKTRPLTKDERAKVDAEMQKRGVLTPGQFKDAVRALTGKAPDNLERMLTHPDAADALILDPALQLVNSGALGVIWKHVADPRTRAHTLTNLRRGKAVTVRALLAAAPAAEDDFTRWFDGEALRKKRKEPLVLDAVLDERHRVKIPKGRAPYTRKIMREACDDVFKKGIHPAEEDGVLYRTEAIRAAQLQRALDEQTNNHLVRHRLRLLAGDSHAKPKATDGLFGDLVRRYAGGDFGKVARIVIEVNRDLRDLSGKDSVELKEALRQRLNNFKGVAEKVTELLGGKRPGNFASLVRKARVAADLGCRCPYTGRDYDLKSVLSGAMALDHVIPYSLRPSNSLDSLVVTFPHINDKKTNMTGLGFIQWINLPENRTLRDSLGVWSETQYVNFVKGLEMRGHDDDHRRKKNRKRFLLLRDYVEKEFTPGDLTQTSQLVRLGAQALARHYLGNKKPPVITSLPGSVTGLVRKAWKLEGCLATANPQVLDPEELDDNGKPRVRTKTEIRGITHLHHALDACVIAFAARFLPGQGRDGEGWRLLVQRRLKPEEQQRARELFAGYVEFDAKGTLHLADLACSLKDQIRLRLAESRVVQHLPAEWGGLPTKETVWRVFDPADPHRNARRLGRWLAAKGIPIPKPEDSTVILISRKRKDAKAEVESGGKTLREAKTWRWVYTSVERSKVLGLGELGDKKLRALKGGKLIADNYGLALFPGAPKGEQFRPIRFFRVWEEIAKLPRTADGRRPPILRRGQLVTFARGRWAGKVWRILGVEENGRIRFFEPDRVRRIDKPENYQKAQITSLLRDGLRVWRRPPLCGIELSPAAQNE